MPIATTYIPVFFSSTLEDLEAERNVLQRDVFPQAWRPFLPIPFYASAERIGVGGSVRNP